VLFLDRNKILIKNQNTEGNGSSTTGSHFDLQQVRGIVLTVLFFQLGCVATIAAA
jgi:hypothetical protein